MPFCRIPATSPTLSIGLLSCSLLLLPNSACGASRIGGIYIAHGEQFVNMLQLTESQNGQISGVLYTIDLSSDGSISTNNISITSGTIDGDQLTLHLSELAVFGENIGGTANGNTIRFQSTGKDGTVQEWDFRRGSLDEFKSYGDSLKAKGEAIILNSKLVKNTQVLHQTVSDAETWISNAELHAQRIPNAKDHFQRLENQMRSLVAREHATLDSVTRSQISVAVIQLNVNGTQTDLEVNQLWDLTIGNSGQILIKTFSDYPSNCYSSAELQRRGATLQIAEEWHSACEQALAERTKFEPEFTHIMEQRAELKSFQSAAEAKRQKFVDEASRIQ
jgi:hypothetical protein